MVNETLPEEVLVEVYFSDHRINRMLRSIRNVNSSIALPSIVLIAPILLVTFVDPDGDPIVLLILGIFPAAILCQVSAMVAIRAAKNRSVKLLEISARLALVCFVLGSIGLLSVGALLVLIMKPCIRITCVTDAICSSILGLIMAVGVVFNLIHWRILRTAIWDNQVLRERAMAFEMASDLPPVATVSEHLPQESNGFFYFRMEEEPEECNAAP